MQRMDMQTVGTNTPGEPQYKYPGIGYIGYMQMYSVGWTSNWCTDTHTLGPGSADFAISAAITLLHGFDLNVALAVPCSFLVVALIFFSCGNQLLFHFVDFKMLLNHQPEAPIPGRPMCSKSRQLVSVTRPG